MTCIVFTCICASGVLAAAEENEYRPGACIPVSQFQLAGLGIHEEARSALRRFGTPIQVTETQSEDDGGRYGVTKYKFRSVEVDVGRGHIERIASTTVGQAFAGDVSIGMEMQDVAERLRFHQWFGEELTVILTNCGAEAGLEARLSFRASADASAFTLWRIELTGYGP